MSLVNQDMGQKQAFEQIMNTIDELSLKEVDIIKQVETLENMEDSEKKIYK